MPLSDAALKPDLFTPTGTHMLKPADILIALKTQKPAMLKGLPDAKALALIRATLAAVGDAVESATGEEPIRVPGLGVFMHKLGKKVEGGKEVATTRVVFRRIKPPVKTVAAKAAIKRVG
ncbi:hypothetical protein KBW71_19295 [Hydrogenophaga aromaticivorans]|uniref:hypothetical protein n=1 Tax=Hydrogenophaga aromaticivorans TaxID=2610898 RepID=UPI001B394A31|nr:hypothetical protein [Hydrogenophaga aromaticivorans]MBQ0920583.1 hypothetical protein [Hydrogenophaga aromaticivorans]